MATKQQIMNAHRQNPNWNGPQIAKHLRCSESYVRVVAARHGLKIPRKHYERDPNGSIQRLGEACKTAGLTLRDIEAISTKRSDKCLTD